MRPRPWLLCFASFVALSGGLGCDLGPGEGFTTAEISAEVRWDMSGRLLDNGRLKTSKNYEIEVRRFDVNFGNVELETSARIAGDSFDPANPPEGYTLCHNGHCHNENDELIAYEDIRLELGGGATGDVLTRAIHGSVVIDPSTESSTYSLVLGACSDARGVCEVGPDSVSAAGIGIESVALELTAYHRDLPDDGMTLALTVPVDVVVRAPLSIALGVDGPDSIQFSHTLSIGASMWDQIEFIELTADAARRADLFRRTLHVGTSLEVSQN